MDRLSEYEALRAAGWSLQAIADKYHIHKSTVSRTLNKHRRVVTMHPHEMNNLDPSKIKAML